MNFAEKCVRFAYRHRPVLAAAFAAMCVAAFFAAKTAPFKTDAFDLLPFRDARIENAEMAAKWFGASDSLYFNVSARDPETARNCALALKGKLAKAGFGFAEFPDPAKAAPEIFRAYPSLFDDMAALERAVSKGEIRKRFAFYMRKMSGFEAPAFKAAFFSDPVGAVPAVLSNLKNLARGMGGASSDGSLVSDASGKNFLLAARASADPRDSDESARVCAAAAGAVAAAERAFPGSEIDWAGACRISADNAQIARADSSACLPATCALMLALCMFAFRNRLFAVAAVAPSLLGSAAAFCFARAAFDEISSISVAFASIAMGVGIDYAIHILYPLDLRGKFGIDFAAKTAGELSLPVSVICATTLLAFIAVACLGGGMAQLGIFGFAGVAASAAISVLALPAFAAGISRGGLRPTFLEKFSGKLVVSQLRRPRAFLFAASALTAAALPFALGADFDGRISALNALSDGSAASDAKVREVWGGAVSAPQIVAFGSDEDAALRNLARAEEAAAGVAGAQPSWVSKLCPQGEAEARNLARWEAFWTPARLEKFSRDLSEVCRENGISPAAFKPALDFLASARRGSVSLRNSPEMSKIFAGRIFSDGRTAAVCAPVFVGEGASKDELAQAVESAGGGAFLLDMEYLGDRISESARAAFLKCAAFALAAVGVFLAFALRSAKRAACVMACVCAGLVWCFALMKIFGVSITLTNSVFVIFSVCLAQDYAVMILWAAGRGSARPAAGPVLLSALTTSAAFGALAFARHPVISGLGAAAAISMLSIFCASLCIAPAWAKISGEGSGSGR